MKERFLNLAAAGALAIMTFATPAALAADDCGYDNCCYPTCNNYCDERCISIFADYLYWTVCPSSLCFAAEERPLTIRATPPTTGTPTSRFASAFDLVDPVNSLGGINDRHCNTKYKSGFRIGFAYHMPDQWDLEVAYTYFHPDYKAHGRACAGGHLRPCGLPDYRLSVPVELALEVPPQNFALIAGSSTSSTCPVVTRPYRAVNFIDASGSSAPVKGDLTGTCVSDEEPFDVLTSSLIPPVSTGDLAPLRIEGTTDATNRFFLTIPDVAFDIARLRARIKYDVVDILFAKRYDCGGCVDYVPYVGARIFSFEEDLCTNFGVRNNSNSNLVSSGNRGPFLLRTHYKLKLPSAGLTFGTRMNYAVCDCFNLFGHIGASILGGNAKQSFKWDNYLLRNALADIDLPANVVVTDGVVTSLVPWTITTDIPHTHRHRSRCQVIFGLDASLGIGYEWCACNVPVLIGVGYEIQSWWNMPPHRGAHECCGGGSSSFTVHGLFVRLGFGF